MNEKAGRDIRLEVDGGIDAGTAPLEIDAGADVLVAGTATFKGGPDAYADNIRRLRGARPMEGRLTTAPDDPLLEPDAATHDDPIEHGNSQTRLPADNGVSLGDRAPTAITMLHQSGRATRKTEVRVYG